MKNEIENLEKLIENYKILIEIHTMNEVLQNSPLYAEYIDSILDAINIAKAQIAKLKTE